MRGRVLILLIIILVAAVGVGALLILNDGGSTEDTATPDAGQQQPTAEPGLPTFTPAPRVTEIVQLVPVVISLQTIPRGSVLTADDIDTSASSAANALLSIRFLPLAYAPETAIQDPTDLIGCVTRTDIPRESILVQAQVVPDPRLVAAGLTGGLACQAVSQGISRVGSDLALFLPADYTAISVPLDPTGYGQVAYGLKAGDRVDVYMSFLFIDVDEEFQTRKPNTINYVTITEEGLIQFSEARLGREEPSTIVDGVVIGPSEERQRPRLVTQRTVTNALVMHMGWVPEDGVIFGASPTPFETPAVILDPTQAASDPVGFPLTLESIIGTDFIPVIMVLGMPPQDALTLTWAIDTEIPVRYGLRPVVADDTVFGPGSATEPVTLLYILETYGIDPANDAAKLPFALEPAVEDIRRFDLRNLRTFVDFTEGFQVN